MDDGRPIDQEQLGTELLERWAHLGEQVLNSAGGPPSEESAEAKNVPSDLPASPPTLTSHRPGRGADP